MWIDPARMDHNLVWRHPWPADIITYLVSLTNPQGTITNSDLQLSITVLQEATLLEAFPKDRMVAPRSGSDNTPTVSWSAREASMINQVDADLLHICALRFREFFLHLSVCYLPGQENCMVDDASRLFY